MGKGARRRFTEPERAQLMHQKDDPEQWPEYTESEKTRDLWVTITYAFVVGLLLGGALGFALTRTFA